MKNKELKIGQKLYRLYYASHPFMKEKRCVEQHTITKIFKNHFQTFGRGYKITKDKIGSEYFFDKKDMYKFKVKLHEHALNKIIYNEIKPLEKEIKYLENKVRVLK